MSLDRLLAPLKRQVRLAVSRCIVALIDDTAKLQEVQVTVLADEVLDRREHFQHYGFTSVPRPGAEGIMLSVGGQRAHGVVIAIDDRRFRLTGLDAGEAALYDDLGNVVKLGRDAVTVDAVTALRITAPHTTIVGDVEITGTVTVSAEVTAAGISLVNHTHPGDSGGTTGAPH